MGKERKKMNKVGVLYICTGEYIAFWPEFYLSAEKYFLNDSEIHYYIFTDAKKVEFQNENNRIHVIHQKAYSWPYSTLMRFSIFLSAEDMLKECDYVFFFNANAQFVVPVLEEQFLPRREEGERLLVVRHPGFYNKAKFEFTYDRNPKCSAYIPYWKGDIYVCGGINGGCTEAFLMMCKELSERIEADLKKNIIPEWHDESQINNYILDRNDFRVLSPAYCCPEEWDIPFECIVLLRSKKKYINIDQIRKDAPVTKISVFSRIFNFLAKTGVMIIYGLKNKANG